MPETPAVEQWAVDRLDLDPMNARLREDMPDRSPERLLRHFLDEYNLEELAWSMAERGYFPEEPLLTISADGDPDRRIVVEGNRRLATLKLLTDVQARRAGGAPQWDELAELAAGQSLARVPIRNYRQRRELLEYLGFRHVSGLLQWSAEAKARFVHRLITEYDYTFQRAGKVIGSRSDAIRRQFIAWGCLTQARAADVDVDEAVRHFGVFYRALQNPSIRVFLELDSWTTGTEETLSPLGEEGPEHLREFLGYVFGRKRVIRESRQLDELGLVLADTRALAVLREERDLAMASLEIPPDRQAVLAAIRLSYRQASRATGEAWQFQGDSELHAEATRLSGLVAQLVETLGKT